MEEKITKYRSLLGEQEAIKRNKENGAKNIEFLKTQLQQLQKQQEEYSKKEKVILGDLLELEKVITTKISQLIQDAKDIETLNDRYEEEGYSDEEEKLQIIESYRKEEKLIYELTELKRWINFDFGFVPKRRAIAKKSPKMDI